MEKDLSNWQGKYEESKRQNESLLFKQRELENEQLKSRKELELRAGLLQKQTETLDKLRLVNRKLKDACSEQEKQLDIYQSMYDGKVDENQKVVEESLSLLRNEQHMQNELRIAQDSLAQLRRQKEELEARADADRQDFEHQLALHKERIRQLESALECESDNSSDYAKEISQMQNDCFSKDMELKRLQAELSQQQRELLIIKEEASRHITAISNFKSQHQSLTRMYDDMAQKYSLAKSRICTMLEENDLKDSNFEYEKLRLQETNSQQAKLIDYLQTLSERPTKKVSFLTVYCQLPQLDQQVPWVHPIVLHFSHLDILV